MTEEIEFSIIMPALNGEKDINSAICSSLVAIDHYGISGEVIVINRQALTRKAKTVRPLIKGVCSLRRKTAPCC